MKETTSIKEQSDGIALSWHWKTVGKQYTDVLPTVWSIDQKDN